MATYDSTLTLDELIEETLDLLVRGSERPAVVTIGATALDDEMSTQFTLSAGSLNVTDLVEFGDELLLVTSVSSDSTPVHTASRAYMGSTAVGGHPTGTSGSKNPAFPRYQVARAVRHGLSSLNAWVPNLREEVKAVEQGKPFVLFDPDEDGYEVVEVFRVRYVHTTTFRITEIGGWEFFDHDTSAVEGKALMLPSWVEDDTELVITLQTPWEFDDNDEIRVPLGCSDLLPLYAAARLATGRELSRVDIDKVEEWNHEAAIRQGVNQRLIRDLWAEYYRRVDEVRRVQNVPRYRPFRKMRTR